MVAVVPILLLKDYRIAFIERNDELLYTDQYLATISYPLSQGNNYFKNYLEGKSIRYIINSKINEKNIIRWPSILGLSKEEYLRQYSGVFPSIFETMEQLDSFFEYHCELVFTDGNYVLYKIKHQ